MSDTASITVTRKRGYTLIYNDLLPGDGVLSARAWGVYCYLAGRPDGWECRASQLRTVFKEGRDALYAALRQLVDVGLMTKQETAEDGLRRTRYVLDADPGPVRTRRSAPETDSQDPGTQDSGIQDSGTPVPEKPGQVSTEVPSTEGANTEGANTGDESPERRDLNEGRADVDRLCGLLSARLTGRQVKHTVTKAWRDAARLMMDSDGRTERQVQNMIEWSQTNTFWMSNIHSMPTLREKYDRMRDQALRDTPAAPANLHHAPAESPGRQARLAAWG